MKRRRQVESTKGLIRRRKGEKHTLSVAEFVSQQKSENKRKKTKHKRTPLPDFKVVTKGGFEWLGTSVTTQVTGLGRRPTKGDIFHQLTPDVAITSMLTKLVETRWKGAHRISVKDVRAYWAVRAYIQGVRESTLRNNFPLPVDVFGEKTMGYNRYCRIQHVYITPDAVKYLNTASEALIIIPEVITIDEKLKQYVGETPYRRYVPNKDPPTGHWITEAVVKGGYTGLPYLLNAQPVQQNSGPTMCGFYQNALANLSLVDKSQVVVVTDAYYIDDQSRTWLRENNIKYFAVVNPTRFKEIWDMLQLKVKHIGQWCVAWNDTTKEAACHYWDPEHGKIYLLTNAFRYKRGKCDIADIPFHSEYKHLFNTADRLNHFVAKKWYPYRREGWVYSFDDFHFTCLLWNTYICAVS